MKKVLANNLSTEANDRELTGQTRHRLAMRLAGNSKEASQTQFNDTCLAHRGKSQLTNVEVFRQIIKEKHLVSRLTNQAEYTKFSKKIISSGLRNGIVTRAFSRSKLEKYIRSDPDMLKLSLKSRVNTIIQNGQNTQSSPTNKHASQQRGFSKFSTNNESYNLMSRSQSNLLENARTKKSSQILTVSRDLRLKDFPVEKTEALQSQKHMDSAGLIKSKPRSRNLSMMIKQNRNKLDSSTIHFFPQGIKVSSRKDKEIVSGFNNSICYSGRGSLAKTRPSNSREHQ